MVEKGAERDVEQVAEYRRLFAEKHEDDLEALRERAGDEDDGVEFYADEAWLLDELLALATEMAVVALYRVVEVHTGRILRWRWKADDLKKEQTYRFDRLKKWVCRELGTDLTELPGYDAVNELRLANNAVKHADGKASSALRGRKGWVKGEELVPRLDDLFERVAPHIPEYLRALAEIVVPKGATAGPDRLSEAPAAGDGPP